MPRFIGKWKYFKSGNRQVQNTVQYIATREGVQRPQAETYLNYMAKRPRSHGLFSYYDEDIVLSRAAKEAGEHKGIVWTAIFSLKREDAARLGYDTADRWQALLNANASYIAEKMHIAPNNFRWYAAFHDEGDHPHIHFVAYATNPEREYLTSAGLHQIESRLARDIFKDELCQIYEQQTEARSILQQQAEQQFRAALHRMEEGVTVSPQMLPLICELSERLRHAKGKKVYGYLPPGTKKIVNEIVDLLAEDPTVNTAYKAWYRWRLAVLHTYTDEIPDMPPLSAQAEFKTVRNMVIREVLRLEREQTAGQANIGTTQEIPTKITAAEVSNMMLRLTAELGRAMNDSTPAKRTLKGGIDRKRLQVLHRKKQALGHAEGDMELKF